MKWSIRLTILVLFISSAPLHAANFQMDYYTYGSQAALYEAFTRIALFYSNVNVGVLVAALAMLSLATGGLVGFSKGIMQGGGYNPLSTLVPFIIGLVVFVGMVVPKGDLILYDPVTNRVQTVVDLPLVIVAMAGITNKLERATNELSSTASAYPYNEHAGGISLHAIFNVLTQSYGFDNKYINLTLNSYTDNCVRPNFGRDWAQQQFKEHFDKQEAYLAKFAMLAYDTKVYSAVQPNGVFKSCKEAWTVDIQPSLLTATIDNAYVPICVKTGFDITSPAEKLKCKRSVENGNDMLHKTALFNGTLSSDVVVRNKIFADSIYKSLVADTSTGVTMLTNKALILDGFGTGAAAAAWTNTIKATVTVAVLGMITFLLLFIATPLIFKILTSIFGLFFFIAAWGVIDIIMIQSTIDSAYSTLQSLGINGMSTQNIIFAPTEALKATALLGKARSMSIILALVVTTIVAGFTGLYPFANMGQTYQQELDQKGESAANAVLDPSQSGPMIQSQATGQATASVAQNHGMSSMTSQAVFEQSTGISHAGSAIANLGGNSMSAGSRHGSITGSATGGRTVATEGVAGQQNTNSGKVAFQQAYEAQQMQIGSTLGQSQGKRDTFGGSTFSAAHQDALVATTKTASSNQGFDDLREQFNTTHGANLSMSEFGQLFAETGMQGSFQQMNVTGGDVDKIGELVGTGVIKNFSDLQAYQDTAHANGVSISELATSVGQVNAAKSMGMHNALNSGLVTPKAIAQDSMINLSKQGKNAESIMQIANDRGTHLGSMLTEEATNRNSKEYAQAENFAKLADATNMGTTELAQQQAGQGVFINANSTNADSLRAGGIINDSQHNQVQQAPAGLTFNYDTVTGQSSKVTTQSGSSSYDTNVMSSKTGSESNVVTSDPKTFVMRALSPKQNGGYSELGNELNHARKNEGFKQEYIGSLATGLSRIMDRKQGETLSDMSSESAQAGANFDSSRTLIGKGVEKFTGATINASASKGINNFEQDTATTSSNENYHRIDDMFKNTYKESYADAVGRASSRQFDSEQDKTQYIESTTKSIWANKFSSEFNSEYNDNLADVSSAIESKEGNKVKIPTSENEKSSGYEFKLPSKPY